MQRPLQPRQYWACTSKLSPDDGRFTRMPAPPAQRRVSDAADHAVGRGVVIARAIVVQRAHDLRCAPRLVDANIAGNIRHDQASVVPRNVGRTARGEDWKERAEPCDHPGRRRRIEIFDRPCVESPVVEPRLAVQPSSNWTV